jgi:hypothetical protein
MAFFLGRSESQRQDGTCLLKRIRTRFATALTNFSWSDARTGKATLFLTGSRLNGKSSRRKKICGIAGPLG